MPPHETYKAHFAEVSASLEVAFRELERGVQPPEWSRYRDDNVVRYLEKNDNQAVIQKLARYLSGLNALQLLLWNGLLQEQCILQRTLDEIGEDIMFLLMPPDNSDEIALKQRYLDSFWQEEFEEGIAPIESTRIRDQIKRRKIRSYVARRTGSSNEQSANRASSLLTRTFSGYVHGASPQIMDMCGGSPLRFRLNGVFDPSMWLTHIEDAWNYFYRGLVTAAAVAKAAQNKKLLEFLMLEIQKAEKFSPHK